jgi:hypothetical protein
VLAAVAATVSFRIGRGGSTTNYVHGLISGARLYNAALLPSDVAGIYANAAAPAASLRGHWRLEEGYGTSASDSSGAGNTGTLSGSPVWVAGETEIVLASPETGPVTGWIARGRERVIARLNLGGPQESFMPNVPDVMTSYSVEMYEL